MWGFADLEAGINAIPEWMEQVGWKRQGVNLDKWVISGHSNGGIIVTVFLSEFTLAATDSNNRTRHLVWTYSQVALHSTPLSG